MTETLLVQIIFGWPAMITSLLLSILGLLLRKPWLLVIAGALVLPFAWYLSGYPLITTPAILLPIFQFGAAWALLHQKRILAWLLLAPLTFIMAFLAVVVLTQNP